MSIADWVMVATVLLAPLLAVQTQKWIERIRERRQGQLWVFRTLMSTRATRVATQHVDALNLIDIDFHPSGWFGRVGRKAVMDEWKSYLDALNVDMTGWEDAKR